MGYQSGSLMRIFIKVIHGSLLIIGLWSKLPTDFWLEPLIGTW